MEYVVVSLENELSVRSQKTNVVHVKVEKKVSVEEYPLIGPVA